MATRCHQQSHLYKPAPQRKQHMGISLLIPVLPDEVSAVTQQILLGGATQFQGPEIIQSHLGRARLARVPPKKVVYLQRP